MPENPKQFLKRHSAAQRAKAATDAELMRQAAEAAEAKRREAAAMRRRNQPPEPEGAPESEAAQWVREYMEWENYAELWVPSNCSWSDYSGSTMDKANGKALIRDHPDLFEESYGGHGTVWVGISEENRLAMTPEQWESIKDTIEGLEDYPVIDEELMSEMEMEAKWADWQEYGRAALREALVKKFEGDANTQIAVLTRRNEFWDELLRDRDLDSYYTEETGASWYFQAEHAVRNLDSDAIYDEASVEAAKKKVFFDEYATPFEEALGEAQVFAHSADQLWDMVKHVEYVAGAENIWEVDHRFNEGVDINGAAEECDPKDHLTFDVAHAVHVMSEPEQMQKMLHRHWAEDPRQLKLPDFESLARRLVGTLLAEGENPKSTFKRITANPPAAYAVYWKTSDGEERENMVYACAAGALKWAKTPEEAGEIVKRLFHRKFAELIRIDSLTAEQANELRKQRVARAQARRVTEAEDPKGFLMKLSNPKGIPRRWVGNMPKKIEIRGRRWFSRTYGNTYFTAKIYVDDQLVHTMPEEYGYNDQYMHRSFEWLEKNGFIPVRPRGQGNMADPPWRWAEKQGFKLEYGAEDVRLRRYLFV